MTSPYDPLKAWIQLESTHLPGTVVSSARPALGVPTASTAIALVQLDSGSSTAHASSVLSPSNQSHSILFLFSIYPTQSPIDNRVLDVAVLTPSSECCS